LHRAVSGIAKATARTEGEETTLKIEATGRIRIKLVASSEDNALAGAASPGREAGKLISLRVRGQPTI
jgi:hypothetical protein